MILPVYPSISAIFHIGGVRIFGHLSPALLPSSMKTFRRAPPIYNPTHSLVFCYPVPSLQRDWIPTSESMAQILEPLPGLDLLSLPEVVGPMIMVTVGCERLLTFCPQELPPTPRLRTIPLPLIFDASAREKLTSLAPTKPKITENNSRPEVSRVFTPLEIVLCSNGIDGGQAVWFQEFPRQRVNSRPPGKCVNSSMLGTDLMLTRLLVRPMWISCPVWCVWMWYDGRRMMVESA